MNIVTSIATRNEEVQSVLNACYEAFEIGEKILLTDERGHTMKITANDALQPKAEMKEGVASFTDFDQFEIFIHHNVQNRGYAVN